MTDLADRLPPHSIEAEMCYLASVMLSTDREQQREFRRALCVEDFYQPDHGILFTALTGLLDRDKPMDAMIVREELIRMGQLDKIGGTDYLAELLNCVPNCANALGYAEKVRETAVKRRIISHATQLIEDAYQVVTDETATEIARRGQSQLGNLATSGTADTVIRLGDAAVRVLERFDNPDVVRRIPTGLNVLDAVLGGLPKKKFTIVGADPRVGKSTFCKQVLLNVAMAGIPCGLVTVEEDAEKVAENMLANRSDVANHYIAHGKLSDYQRNQVDAAAVELAKLPYFLDETPVKLSEVVASVERMAGKYGCQVVVVDHLHLIEFDGSEKAKNREQEVSKVSKALKATFKRLDVAGVACAQLNRAAAKGKPELRNLRDSGNLEADADAIVLLWRQDAEHYRDEGYVPNGLIEANVAKNKDGQMAEVVLKFSDARQSVSDPDETDPFA